MKEYRDTPRPTMSDEEMVKDYPRLAREYTLLHQDYREAIRKQCDIPVVSQRRELLPLAFIKWYSGMTQIKIENAYDRWLKEKGNCG